MQTKIILLFTFLLIGFVSLAQTVEKDSIKVISIEEFEKNDHEEKEYADRCPYA